MGASLVCSFGTAPSNLVVLPDNHCLTSGRPAANIRDHEPLTNILPFGMCLSPTNSQSCVPVTPAPWTPGSVTVLLAGQPCLNTESSLKCSQGGVITVENPGQMTEEIP